MRAETHKVAVDELSKWQSEEKMMFASSSQEDKQLYATLRGSYEVWHKGRLVKETIQPFSAVESYNSI
jgi:hypothetical protein